MNRPPKPNTVIKINPPQPAFRKHLIRDMEPGTIFVNAYHSPATIMGGGDKFSIYMRVSPRNDGFSTALDAQPWTGGGDVLVVNLRNGNAYNLRTKKHSLTEGYILSAEFVLHLLP